MSRDGFMNWSSASEPAFKAGAYFATRKSTIEIPASSLAANERIAHEKEGVVLPATDGRDEPLTAQLQSTRLAAISAPLGDWCLLRAERPDPEAAECPFAFFGRRPMPDTHQCKR